MRPPEPPTKRVRLSEHPVDIMTDPAPPPPTPCLPEGWQDSIASRDLAGQRSAGWYSSRDQMITASDVAAILGLNPYCSPNQVLGRKLGTSRPRKGNVAAMEHGVKYESEAIAEFEARQDRACLFYGLVRHKTIPWLGGSPDAVTTLGELVETKCPLMREIRHEISVYYYPQVQILLEVLDLEHAFFVQYRPEGTWNAKEYDCLEIKRDREWFARALPTLERFHEVMVERRAIQSKQRGHVAPGGAAVDPASKPE